MILGSPLFTLCLRRCCKRWRLADCSLSFETETDDRSNAYMMLSHELASLLEPQFRGKGADRVNAAEEVLRLRRQNDVTGDGEAVEGGENLLGREGRLEKKRVAKTCTGSCPRTSCITKSLCPASSKTCGSFWTGPCEHV